MGDDEQNSLMKKISKLRRGLHKKSKRLKDYDIILVIDKPKYLKKEVIYKKKWIEIIFLIF